MSAPSRLTPAQRIEAAVRTSAQRGAPALVAYLTAGFPSREGFRQQLQEIATDRELTREIRVEAWETRYMGSTLPKIGGRNTPPEPCSACTARARPFAL